MRRSDSLFSGISASSVIALALVSLLFLFQTAKAEPVRDGAVAAELLAEDGAIVPGKPFTVGLKLEIDPGWHTYWKNPGDSGLATKIEWQLPEGFSAKPIQFPTPHRFEVDFGGIKQVGLGYTHDQVPLHLIQITPPAQLETGAEITLSGKATWLMCDDHQCVPGGVDLSLALPVANGTPHPGPEGSLFEEARKAMPAPASDWTTEISESGEDALSLAISPPNGVPLPDAASLVFYPESAGLFDLSSPQQFTFTDGQLTATIPKAPYFQELPDPFSGVLISPAGFESFDNRNAVLVSTGDLEVESPKADAAQNAESEGAPTEDSASDASTEETAEPVPTTSEGNLFLVLLFGFIGGMILNVMPCVFPVISLKILSFVSHAGDERKKVVMHGVVYTVGILLFFLGLAALVIALGLAWGGQFQSPIFVMVMTAVIVVLSLSLFGVFEIGVKLTSVGGGLTQSNGYAGSFWSGALAVILATPCTGPFLGSSLGWALEQPPIIVFAFFTMMGLGMAAPYVLLTMFPALTKRLPRPGPWMETFKQVMGFPMMAAAVFLLWILNGQIGDTGLAWFMGSLVMLSLASWAWGRFAGPGNPSRKAGMATVGFGVVASVFLAWFALEKSGEASEEGGSGDSRPIAEIIESHRAAGKHVFVDFTARWCAICQTNKPAMYAEETKAAFEEYGVEFVVADWTNKSDDIYQFLKKHGRRSVPYYPLFPSDTAKGPLDLPQNLTPGIIRDHLEKLENVEANFPSAEGN